MSHSLARRPTEVRTKSATALVRSLMTAELRVFVRQPVMIALTLLLPVGLLAITWLAETSDSPQVWAQIAGRNMVATQCITVYFVALNTVTARRHTLALKRLRTTALPSFGIVVGLLTPPVVVGAFQILAVLCGLIALGSPPPQNLWLIIISAVTGTLIAALAGVVTSAFTSTPEKAQWTMLPLFVLAMGATAVLPLMTDEATSFGLRLLPLVANTHMTTAGWFSDVPIFWPVAADLLIMCAWIGILGTAAWRTFRWERRR